MACTFIACSTILHFRPGLVFDSLCMHVLSPDNLLVCSIGSRIGPLFRSDSDKGCEPSIVDCFGQYATRATAHNMSVDMVRYCLNKHNILAVHDHASNRSSPHVSEKPYRCSFCHILVTMRLDSLMSFTTRIAILLGALTSNVLPSDCQRQNNALHSTDQAVIGLYK